MLVYFCDSFQTSQEVEQNPLLFFFQYQVNDIVNCSDSHLASRGVLRHLQPVGGVGELRRSVPGQDGHGGRWSFTSLFIQRLDVQPVLFTGAQGSTCGSDFTGTTSHLEAVVAIWKVGG